MLYAYAKKFDVTGDLKKKKKIGFGVI